MNAAPPLAPDDELAIRNLLARYGDAVCRRDAAGWVATWSADCTWDLGGGRVTHGRDETFALWQKSLAKYPWVMHLGHYDDTYVRDEGEWRFGVRRFHLVYRGAMDPGTVNPLPER